MELSREKEVLNLMDQCFKAKTWDAFLCNIYADQVIPDDFLNSPAILYKLASIYMHAARKEDAHVKYTALAHMAYTAVLHATGHTNDMKAAKGLAYLYYNEFFRYSKKGNVSIAIPKSDCEENTIRLYKKITADAPDMYDLYRYAHFLYSMSNDMHSKCPFNDKRKMKENSYQMYVQTTMFYENLGETEKTPLQRLYIKSCYGVARCGLELIANRSFLLNELILLFKFQPVSYSAPANAMERLKEISRYLGKILQMEALPPDTNDIGMLADSEQIIARAGDVYYMLGKFYDISIQYSLCYDKKLAYEKAEKYYTYACEIDSIRRSSKKVVSGFNHMYWGLLNLYLRCQREDKFCTAWNKYHHCVGFDDAYKFLFRARWLILKREYEKAKQVLLECKNMIKQKPNIDVKKINILLDAVHIISGGHTDALVGEYTPYQKRYLYELSQR